MEVRATHDAAVAAERGHLEEHAACARRGKVGVRQTLARIADDLEQSSD